MIHPTAIVAADAKIGAGVSIGPYAVVEADTEIGDRCQLLSHAVVCSGTILGAGVVVHSFAVVGGLPQSLSFDAATPSGARVGAGTVLREGVTVNRSTQEGGFTVLGEKCFLMANAHVAHDCALGHRVIAANDVMIAGHCEIGDDVFFGGGCGLHQFLRVGAGAMVGGHASLSFDVPPDVMVADRNVVHGLNLVGLRRRGVEREVVAELKALFGRVYGARNPKTEAVAALAENHARSNQGRRFLEFFNGGKRGVCRPERRAENPDEKTV